MFLKEATTPMVSFLIFFVLQYYDLFLYLALSKANQDSYVICENFLNDKNSHFFGIFDGHGEFGDYCSYFAADMVQMPFFSYEFLEK
jgi:serine/threonine protein phosphatase PrpC